MHTPLEENCQCQKKKKKKNWAQYSDSHTALLSTGSLSGKFRVSCQPCLTPMQALLCELLPVLAVSGWIQLSWQPIVVCQPRQRTGVQKPATEVSQKASQHTQPSPIDKSTTCNTGRTNLKVNLLADQRNLCGLLVPHRRSYLLHYGCWLRFPSDCSEIHHTLLNL